MHARTLALGLVAVAAALSAGAAGARPEATLPPIERVVLFTVTLDGHQSTTWKAHGASDWCATSSQRVPLSGEGGQELSFHGAQPLVVGMLIGGTLPTNLGFQLTASGERHGSFTMHYGAVTDRPTECDTLPTGDVAAPTDCGQVSGAIGTATVQVGRHVELRTIPGRVLDGRSACPWLADGVDHDGTTPLTSDSADRYPDGAGGVIALDLRGVHAPAAPFRPASMRLHAAKSWHASADGSSLDVTSTLDVTLHVVLRPTLVPGREISGVRIGATYRQLQHLGHGYAVAPGDASFNRGSVSTWDVTISLPYLSPRGDRERMTGVVLSPRIGSGPQTLRRPPPTARLVSLYVPSTLEVTAAGIGQGSTLAELRRARPRGHMWTGHASVGLVREWVIPGPGRRLTGIDIYNGGAGNILIGCPAPPGLAVAVVEGVRC